MDTSPSSFEENDDMKPTCHINDKKRLTRNENEKKRRDQFNNLIEELMLLVNHGNKKKMDKSLVLQNAISILKNQKNAEKVNNSGISENNLPTFLTTGEYCQLMLEALDGFLLVMSQDYIISYVSENVTSVLGHLPSSMVDKSFFLFVNPTDHHDVRIRLQLPGYVPVFLHPENHFEFCCRLERNLIKKLERQAPEYCSCKVTGGFRSVVENEQTSEAKDAIVLLINSVIPILSKDICVIDENNTEFQSRLSLEWKILYLDHKASSIIGYSPIEVVGTCGYDYYHSDDLEYLSQCHLQLIRSGQVSTGYYRFLTKNQQWIWIKSQYSISFNQWSCKPEFVVCKNVVVSYRDVVKFRQQSVERSAESSPDLNFNSDVMGKGASSDQSACGQFVMPREQPPPHHVQEASKSAKSRPTWSNFLESMPGVIMQPFEKISDFPPNTAAIKENLLARQKELTEIIRQQQYELDEVQRQLAEYSSNQDLIGSDIFTDDLLSPSSFGDCSFTEDIYDVDWSNFI